MPSVKVARFRLKQSKEQPQCFLAGTLADPAAKQPYFSLGLPKIHEDTYPFGYDSRLVSSLLMRTAALRLWSEIRAPNVQKMAKLKTSNSKGNCCTISLATLEAMALSSLLYTS